MYLDNNDIQYFLLRPIDLDTIVEDIDLIIPKADFNKLLIILDEDSKDVYLRYSNANESIQLFIDELLLDVKFNICFLPRKTLVINDRPPYCSIIVKENRYIYPEIRDEVLFTFWTYHLLLDKKQPIFSSTYLMYNNYYKNNWEYLIDSDFFIKWTNLIFKKESKQAIRFVKLFFNHDMNLANRLDNKKIQRIAIYSNHLLLNFYLDKYYFKLLRLFGYMKIKRSIFAINIK